MKNKKLDSSIKRNTSLIKKLKQGISRESKASLLKDLSEVSLEKYLSEIINTAAEGLSNVPNKNEDINAAVEVISAMHQRFNVRFTCGLFELFLHNFANPENDTLSEKEELTRVSKLKCNLRLFTELYLVGIFTTLDNVESKECLPAFLQKRLIKKEPILFSIFKEILNYKFKQGFTTSIATSFMKRFPQFFETDDITWDKLIYDTDLKSSLQSLFKVFTDAVFSRAAELDKKTKKLLKEHQKCQIRTGKVTDEYIDEYNLSIPIYERFKSAAILLAEFFNLDAPVLDVDLDKQDEETLLTPLITNSLALPGQRLWENEETRKFYEKLPDIDEVYNQSIEANVDANSDTVNSFFKDLENAETKDSIDKLSLEYWSNGLDNKATRKRLLKFFIETQDWSKLRIYARFFATSSKYFPEVIEEFILYLDNGFRSQLRSNKINVKNIIFFSEMVKFMLLPSYMIFHKIRTLIINLQVPNNIEILTVFFEHLGLFLINKPEYKSHMEQMMELIRENKKDKQLSMNLKGALDNLINLVYPPSIRSLNADAKVLSPEQQFYRILVRRELENFDYKHVSKLLRKAHWKNEDVYNTLFELFTKPEDVSYQNIPLLAQVLKELYTYHRNFVITCIDETLEKIDRGLEINDYGQNMHRISEVKFLAETYNYEIIKPDVILDTIYHIMRFGHLQGETYLFCPNELDAVDNYFRIQLITTILLNVKRTPSALTNKIALFLRFFEYYTMTKLQPLPKEIKFRVEDTFAKFTTADDFERSSTLQECAIKLSNTLKLLGITSAPEDVRATDAKEADSEEESGHDNEDDEDDIEAEEGFMEDVLDNADARSDLAAIEHAEEEVESGEDGEEEQEDDDDAESGTGSNEDEEEEEDEDESDEYDNYRDIDADRNIEKRRMYEEYHRRLKDEEERKMEIEMEKQLQQILLESIDSRKNEKVPSSKIPMITSRNESNKPKLLQHTTEFSSIEEENHTKPKKIAFTFLSKSGKKTQSRVLGLPSNLQFVSGVLEEEERLKNEREKIKNIVLQRAFD